MKPREIIRQLEAEPSLPAGNGDRFAGYAVIGLPFQSGHVLALRRFAASSLGPGYTSVWHRDARGVWTFYSTINPDLGCSRYFGGEITHNIVTPIDIEWTGPACFNVNILNVNHLNGIVGAALRWELRLTQTWPVHLMNAAASVMPDQWWQSRSALKAMGVTAQLTLGAGKVNLTGITPNGQEFFANPRRLWLVDTSRAVLNGLDLGPTGPLARQARLNDFLIPQRGLFAVARAFLRRAQRIQSQSRSCL
jgi:hypothetical protein